MFHVYTKPDCPQCVQAKVLLTNKGLPFQEFILDVGQNRELGKNYVERDEVLSTFPGARTMPQIALAADGNFQHIGGFAELKASLP